MPVATQVVAGNKADDLLYIPAIDQVRAGVGCRGLLYIGDCKMMSLKTRTYLKAGGDDYLVPFSLTQESQELLGSYLKPVWAGEQALMMVERRGANEKQETIAEGFERYETLTARHDDKEITWVERFRRLEHDL